MINLNPSRNMAARPCAGYLIIWLLALVLPVFGAQAGVVFTSLYSFTGTTNDGANPYAGLVQGKDGDFYGTTFGYGVNNWGTVFKITPNGAFTRLYSFSGTNNGVNPSAGLVQGSDGYFYGTTIGNLNVAGTEVAGTVFKISTNGTLTNLYSFTAATNGVNPNAALVQGSDGYFYGTTSDGGRIDLNYPFGYGTVFKITPTGAFTSLYSFTDGTDDLNPEGLVLGSDGYFYGTTAYSGRDVFGNGVGAGMVFKISTNGTLTNLHDFFGITTSDLCDIEINGQYNDGANSMAGLVQGTDGYFYGTTEAGGTNGLCTSSGNGFIFKTYGAVFKISTNGVETILHSFTGVDGQHPVAGLVQGSDGNFYGTTVNDGTTFSPSGLAGYGSVFQITAAGAFTSFYSFGSIVGPRGQKFDGANPEGGLVQGSDGSFYGTTYAGGTNGFGTVFRLTIVPPQLTIIPAGANVVLSWPTNYVGFAAGFTLESATNLVSPTVWNTNSTPPVVIGDQNFVTNPISGTQMFFRLTQ